MDEGYFLGLPPGQSWSLSASALQAVMQARYPEALLRLIRPDSSGAAALDFSLALGDGETYKGTYSETGVLALVGGTPRLWADTMVWFLSLVPDGPVFGMREENPLPVPLPGGARSDPGAIARFFEDLGSEL